MIPGETTVVQQNLLLLFLAAKNRNLLEVVCHLC